MEREHSEPPPPAGLAGSAVVVGRAQQVVPPGTMIGGKYRVEKELGRGGFGIVVRAVHLAIGQVVAIKILTAGEGGAPEWAEDAARFKREAQATAALRSEHVVRILDVDLLENGSPYMVMEYLEGETLHHAIHTRGPLAVGEAVDHMMQVLAALAEAHAAGIVHRDLKPANVLVTRGAGGTFVAKVLDFGVSKIGASSGIGSVSSAAPLTRTGAVIGTVAYMAPEQMVDAKRVDARADLWSVGIMLYELLTKETPFGPQKSATLVTEMLTKPPVRLSAVRPDLPAKLEKIVLRCLEKDPARRFATATKIGEALAELSTARAKAALDALRRAGRPTGAAAPVERGAPKLPTTTSARTRARLGRTTLTLAIVAAVTTVALLGFAALILLSGPKRQGSRSSARASASVAAPASSPAPGSSR